MAAGCGEAAEMMARAAAMVLVGAVAGLGRLGGGSGRCLGPPWSAAFGSPQRLRITPAPSDHPSNETCRHLI